jgi:P-type Mg2+ transporter
MLGINEQQDAAWWSEAPDALLVALHSTRAGLSTAQAQDRFAQVGPNAVADSGQASAARLLWRQFSSPLVLILVIASAPSLLLRDWVDAVTVLAIVAGSTLLGFWQELRASTAVAQLRSRLALNARVRRDGAVRVLPVRELVPGDVVELSAGNLVPADGMLLDAGDFLVNQAALTGESLPACCCSLIWPCSNAASAKAGARLPTR